jgi:hypothetical protein
MFPGVAAKEYLKSTALRLTIHCKRGTHIFVAQKE